MSKKVEIIESCLIEGRHCEVGEIIELDDSVAQLLTSCARVREVVDEDVPAPETKAKK